MFVKLSQWSQYVNTILLTRNSANIKKKMHQDNHPGLEMNIQRNSNVIVRAFISSSRENAHVFTINQSHHIFFGKALRCSVSTSALTNINQHGATSLKPSVKDCRVQNRNTKEEWKAFTCTHTKRRSFYSLRISALNILWVKALRC